MGNTESGSIEDSNTVVVEPLARPADSLGSPFERNAGIAYDDVAESGADMPVCRPVAGPEFAGLSFSVQFFGNDRRPELAELRECSNNRFYFPILFQRIKRLDKTVSDLLRHRTLSYLNSA